MLDRLILRTADGLIVRTSGEEIVLTADVKALSRLKAALLATGLAFEHFGWNGKLDGDYGVFAEDGSNPMLGDNVHAERMIEGTVDYFTHDDSGIPQVLIEQALNGVDNLAWYVNSIQYEDDTGYIHYEWVFQVS